VASIANTRLREPTAQPQPVTAGRRRLLSGAIQAISAAVEAPTPRTATQAEAAS